MGDNEVNNRRTEIKLLPRAEIWVDIIKVLESISEICWLQKSCSDCPFLKDHYCSLYETPDNWQIDSKYDDSVFYKIERSWLRSEREADMP